MGIESSASQFYTTQYEYKYVFHMIQRQTPVYCGALARVEAVGAVISLRIRGGASLGAMGVASGSGAITSSNVPPAPCSPSLIPASSHAGNT